MVERDTFQERLRALKNGAAGEAEVRRLRRAEDATRKAGQDAVRASRTQEDAHRREQADRDWWDEHADEVAAASAIIRERCRDTARFVLKELRFPPDRKVKPVGNLILSEPMWVVEIEPGWAPTQSTCYGGTDGPGAVSTIPGPDRKVIKGGKALSRQGRPYVLLGTGISPDDRNPTHRAEPLDLSGKTPHTLADAERWEKSLECFVGWCAASVNGLEIGWQQQQLGRDSPHDPPQA